MNNFPPLFPNTKFLDKKPWHKIIWFLSFIYCASSIYSFFLAFLVLLNSLSLIKLSINVALTAPMTISLYPLMVFSKPTSHPGTNISYPAFQDPQWGLIILMCYFFISIFLPSVIYRVLLTGMYGKKWRGK